VNTPDVLIRRAKDADIEALASCHCAMAMETENLTLDPETTLRGTRAVLDDPSKGFYLVAEREGVRVGQLMVTFEWSDWRNGTFWWIQSVYVEPFARRKGVYRALYEAVKNEAAAAKDVCGIRLYVETNNQTAKSTYSAMGMLKAHYDIFELDFGTKMS
jgi:GNAT superfamily N-acetyltransferase